MPGADYNVPFTLDPAQFVEGLNTIDEKTDQLAGNVVDKNKRVQDSFDELGKRAKKMPEQFKQPYQSLFNLTERLRVLQNEVFTEKDILKVRNYNKEIELTKEKISTLSNAGKKGFDDFGNAIEKTATKTNVLTKSFSFLRTAAYLIPGIGLAGIFNLIGEGVVALVQSLFQGAAAFDGIKEKMKIFNEVSQEANKQAAEQKVDLDILYRSATNVNLAMADRLAAVKALKAEFPDTFKNIKNETILNGEAEQSYKNLSAAILENARATAAKNKLVEIQGKLLDIQDQKRKINTATFNEKQGIKAPIESRDESGVVIVTDSVQDQIKVIEARRLNAIKEQEINEKRLESQQKFLVQFAGGEQKIAKTIVTEHTKGIEALDKADDAAARKREQAHEKYLNLLAKFLSQEDALTARALPENRAAEIAASDAKFKKIVDDAKREIDQAKVTESEKTELLVQFGKLQEAATGAAREARLDINKKYDDRELKLREAAQKALARIGDNDLDEQINRINQQHNEIIDTVKKAGLFTAETEKKIEDSRTREISDARIKNGEKLIKDSTDLAIAGIKVSEKYAGESVRVEIKKQIAILEEQAKGAQSSLDLLLANGKTENDIEVKNAEEVIKNIKKSIKNKTTELDQNPLSFMELIFGDLSGPEAEGLTKALNKAKESIAVITDFIVSQFQRQIDARQELIDKETKAIDDLGEQLDREKELRDQGFANNVAGIQAELDAKKKQREDDIKQQEELQKKQQNIQKAQLALDTATQGYNLATASTSIFKALAPLGPLGIGLAITTITLMLGAFIASRAKALQAINQGQKFGEGGWIDGKKHSQGGKKYYSPDGGQVRELEEGEHVTRATQAEKYAELLDAVNEDKLHKMSEEGLRAMLAGMGIHLSEEDTRQGLIGARHRDALKTELSLMPGGDITKDVKQINHGVTFMAEQAKQPKYREDENYRYFESPGYKLKIRKRK
jgi:hypothetical protein